MLGYRRKREAENLWDLVLTLYQIVSVHLLETFRPPGSLNMKLGTRRSENTVLEWKVLPPSACLYPIKAVEGQPMYHNSASQCSLCEGKEGAKGIYISMCFVYYRNCSQHGADCLFSTNRQFSVGFRHMQRWDSHVEQFWLEQGGY